MRAVADLVLVRPIGRTMRLAIGFRAAGWLCRMELDCDGLRDPDELLGVEPLLMTAPSVGGKEEFSS